MTSLTTARENMIANHLLRRGITDRRVLEAMKSVPRENFVDPGFEEFAYEDAPLPIGEKQTISQPYIVALMAERARIEPDDVVLEVGTGSGYGAAILSRLAGHVVTIERHEALAREARVKFKKLGFDNIEVQVGDGTRGWPMSGPYGAIVVTAATAEIPQALKDQLDIGGHLVVPLGPPSEQRLMVVERVSATTFEEHDLGGVRFVPLVADDRAAPTVDKPRTSARPPAGPVLPRLIAEAGERLPDFDDPAFGALFDRFGDRRVVLLGEASHGTSEFYKARAAITRRLVEKHGFTIVAVEADWPDAAAIDRYVRRRPELGTEEKAFQRFPTWMWRNLEMIEFTRWMRRHNRELPAARKARFHGLDIYNLRASIAAVLSYLDRVDPEAAAVARNRYACLTPWQNDPATYGRAVLTQGYGNCEKQAVTQCRELLERTLEFEAYDADALLDAVHSARLIASAEKYYRTMYYSNASSWNQRDRHMFETLELLLDRPTAGAKAVVWAHNSHIGDARHTDMGTMREELNIGQLCRERFGDACALIGMGTDSGEVAAAENWDAEMEVMTVRPSLPESYENLFHRSGEERLLVDFGGQEELASALAAPRLERFIGVIYRPESERLSHYMQAEMPSQFDAYLWFDRTSAVSPIDPDNFKPGQEDTFPFGF